jgi:stringent starvation protein B
MVPPAHVRDGQITLNIGNLATNKLLLGNEYIEFQARFNGVIEMVSVPVGAVSAIYARETGAGMGFEVQTEEDAAAPQHGREGVAAAGDGIAAGSQSDRVTGGNDEDPPPPRPHLTIVK